MSALNGWHSGEKRIQRKLGYDEPMAMGFTWVKGEMPEQHRIFYSSNLPFIPITVLDEVGRPWGAVAASKNGEPGFVTSPNESTLIMNLRTWVGDPLFRHAKLPDKIPGLIAGIGIEFSTRRRNKFAGSIIDLVKDDKDLQLTLNVNQAIGNCPKYINIRQLDPYPSKPQLRYDSRELSDGDMLPADVVSFIKEADTVFIGTTYRAPEADSLRFPSHVGMNQRGGRPGFVRVDPLDNRTVVLPDYSGNRLMTSLGNIEVTGLASLTFVSFATGDVLYLTGTATNYVGPEAQAIMPRQNVLTSVFVTGYTMVDNALPVRTAVGFEVQRSPYSPPVKLLASEQAFGDTAIGSTGQATLVKVHIHSPTVATFTWKPSTPLDIRPGQAIALDFTSLLGMPSYQHMAPDNPVSINDDRVRTWTVSDQGEESTFSVTLRAKPGGAVTGALFTIVHKLAQLRPELLVNAAELDLKAEIRGVVGDFVLPQEDRLLLVAGGIGITPFLRMLRALGKSTRKDIVLVVSTRESKIMVDLITSAIPSLPTSTVRVHVFTHEDIDVTAQPSIRYIKGRIPSDHFQEEIYRGRTAMICGPRSFENHTVDALLRAGLKDIRRESFDY